MRIHTAHSHMRPIHATENICFCVAPHPSSSDLHLTRNQETYLVSSKVHTANLSIAKEQQFLQLLTIKPTYNMLVECSKEPPWTQASSHLTVTEHCPEETNQEGEGLCHSTDHIWEAHLQGFLSFLRRRLMQLVFLTFPECVSSNFYFLLIAGKTIMFQ